MVCIGLATFVLVVVPPSGGVVGGGVDFASVTKGVAGVTLTGGVALVVGVICSVLGGVVALVVGVKGATVVGVALAKGLTAVVFKARGIFSVSLWHNNGFCGDAFASAMMGPGGPCGPGGAPSVAVAKAGKAVAKAKAEADCGAAGTGTDDVAEAKVEADAVDCEVGTAGI